MVETFFIEFLLLIIFILFVPFGLFIFIIASILNSLPHFCQETPLIIRPVVVNNVITTVFYKLQAKKKPHY